MAIHFTKEEFADRKSKVINELKKQGLDALLMFRQESMYWLTGYDTFGFVFFQSFKNPSFMHGKYQMGSDITISNALRPEL